MSDNEYVIGQQVFWTVTFRDDTGALATPTTRVCLLQTPDGAENVVAGAGTEISTGVIRWTLPVFTQAGRHVVRGKGTATILASDEESFTVEASSFVNP